MQNYILLASRQIIIALLSIFTSGFLFRAFGEELFGIYGYFLGIFVILFTVSSASSIVIQRWVALAYKNSDKNLYNEIKSALIFYYKLTIAIFSLMFFVLIYMYITDGIEPLLNNYLLNLPFILIVVFVYQLFNSLIISFQKVAISTENFTYLAVISTLDALMKFIFALIVLFCISNDVSSFYTYLSLLFLTSFLICLIWIFCLKKSIFPTQKNSLKTVSETQNKEYSRFAFWSIISAISAYIPIHGMLIVFGTYSSMIFVAAFTLSIQLFIAINSISTSMMAAAVPDLTGKFQYFNKLQKENYIKKSYSYAIGVGLLFWLLASINQDWFTKLWVGDNSNIDNFFIPLSLMGFILITDRISSLILQGYNAQKNYSILSLIFLTLSIVFCISYLKLEYLNVFEVMYIIVITLWVISIYKLFEVFRYSRINKNTFYFLNYILFTVLSIALLYYVNFYVELGFLIAVLITLIILTTLFIFIFLSKKKDNVNV